ncbi:MAG: thiosulfate oxidation carrier protein SoxY [Rhodobacteraceae bacterium]|nr:thiosulfate oxidation carrier protein SoxY [Paracoccaceae bacterium]
MITRRETMALGLGVATITLLPLRASAAAGDAIAAYTGGAAVTEGGVMITAPEIAENGNTVPITVEAPGAAEIAIYADGNPTPGVAVFKFGPAAGSNRASTRIRLGGTQDVVAVAKMPDGSFMQAAVEVKVTIGGCGG